MKTQSFQVDEPNLVLPLGASFDTRGIAGFTNAITNSLDQLKINSCYEIIQNATSGKVTLKLVKRPGVADVGSSYGASGQVAHLWEIAAGATSNAAANRWVFATSGDDMVVSNTSTTTTIVTAAGYAPAFVDKTAISGADTLVVQLRNASGSQTAWTSTAIATFTQISDSVFTGLTHAGKIEHLDGFAFILDSATNRIYNSDLNTLSTWPSTGYISKQISQDIAVGLGKLGPRILAFGMETFEVFQNAGNATGSPLEGMKGAAQKYGMPTTVVTGMRHYTVEMDGLLFWRGNPTGVYAYDGQTVMKVSTPAIDKILAERQHYYVSSVTFQGQRAVVIGLDTPSATTQRALLFFPRWKDWFEWSSTVFIPQSSPRMGTVFLGVDQNQHKLYAISESSDNWQDAGTNYTMTHQFKLPKNGSGLERMFMFGVTGDTARSASNLAVSFSDDDGQNFSTARNIDLTADKKTLYRCGAYRQSRWVKMTHTANLDCRLDTAIARIG